MILYGGLVNQFIVLDIANAVPFSITGAVLEQMAPAVEPTDGIFPIYGATLISKTAPIRHKVYGAVLVNKIAPTRLKELYAVHKIAHLGANIIGLSISGLDQLLVFPTPSKVYNIYPYNSSHIARVEGTTEEYIIVGNQLIFNNAPTGTITLVPFNRLQSDIETVHRLVCTNTIPTRAAFKNIQLSGNFSFSLNSTGPWSNPLSVQEGEVFYVKTNNIEGIANLITVNAVCYPVG